MNIKYNYIKIYFNFIVKYILHLFLIDIYNKKIFQEFNMTFSI